MTIGKWPTPVHDRKWFPSEQDLIVRAPPGAARGKVLHGLAPQFTWCLRAEQELTFKKLHVEQRVMLQQRGIEVPTGSWIALSDAFTADPQIFKRAGNQRHSDQVLLIIQVTAALALEIAVSDASLRLEESSRKIARELGNAGLLRPGVRHEAYSGHAVEKWRKHHKGSSKLYHDGLKIFRRSNRSWTDVLQLACVEARLRAGLHELHRDDPDGSKARAGFEEFLNTLRRWNNPETTR